MWALDRTGQERRRTIGPAEFFVLLLDRLGSDGYDVLPVIEGLKSAAARLNVREIADLAETYETGTNEEDFKRLRELSQGLFRAVHGGTRRWEGRQRDPETFGEAARPLVEATRPLVNELDKLNARFKDHALRHHTRYFETGRWLNPAHLGNMLLCIRGLEVAIQAFKNPECVSPEPFGIDSEALRGVLDWNGDAVTAVWEG